MPPAGAILGTPNRINPPRDMELDRQKKVFLPAARSCSSCKTGWEFRYGNQVAVTAATKGVLGAL